MFNCKACSAFRAVSDRYYLYRFLAVCFYPNSKVAHDNIIQLKNLAERNGRGLLEPALGALVQGVRAKRLFGWLVGRWGRQQQARHHEGPRNTDLGRFSHPEGERDHVCFFENCPSVRLCRVAACLTAGFGFLFPCGFPGTLA